MARPVARLGSNCPAPSIQLLQFLRRCALDPTPQDAACRVPRAGARYLSKAPSDRCYIPPAQQRVTRALLGSNLQQFEPANRRGSRSCPWIGHVPSARDFSSTSITAGAAAAVQLSYPELESLVELEELKDPVKEDEIRRLESNTKDERTETMTTSTPTPRPIAVAARHPTQALMFNHRASEGPRITRYLVEEGSHKRHFPLKVNEDALKQMATLQYVLRYRKEDVESVFRAYRAIPQPRVTHISHHTLRGVLRALRESRIKTHESAARYLSVLDDMMHSKKVLTPRDLSSALVFAGRMADVDPKLALEKALDLYRKLESYGRRAPDIVTFNTLGDLALRARNFELFMKLLQEMQKLGLAHDRYTGTLKLRYWGLLGNAGQVKRTYRDMVAAGEIIETATLNCVIQYLIVAGDALTAEKTFERMKEIDDQKQPKERLNAPVAWNEQKQLSRILSYATWYYRGDEPSLQRMQTATPTGPNTHTYRLIIRHHCFTTKNLLRIIDLLEEMPHRGLFITRPIFYMIFAAFSKNRAAKFSPWSLTHLEGIFDLFLKYIELQEERDRAPITAWNEPKRYDDRCELNGRTVEAILEAYAEHGGAQRVRQVWEQIKDTWEAAPTTKSCMEDLVSSVEAAGKYFVRPSRRPAESAKEHTVRLARSREWDRDDEIYKREERSEDN